ncbi:disease resistance protein RGA2-like [Papaver somniferum]|uniref:disease resistance protein RGA2-like n=1 Tax=Papaver somniferum TaxID=3469 RepID=UPI000E6F7F58|nr:disease resistance protein RGA2-like [Papaver somniferum]
MGSFEHLNRLDISSTSIEELPDSVTGINSLRTVQFAGCRKLKALPSNFGALTRLRYLNCNSTDIKVLPETCISNLCNLEILELGHECVLPKDIRYLTKLRRLTLRREKYDEMPSGLDKLTCLEELDSLMVRKVKAFRTNLHSGMKELADLNLLQVLVIRNLENVRGPIDAGRARLQDKHNIRVLKLHWNEEVIDDSIVLEHLQPHPNLRTLEIGRFGGSKLPKWMGRSDSSLCCLPYLVELCLENCNSCEQLPSFGLLPCLKVLSISKMRSLKCLGKEFYRQEEDEESSSVMVYNWRGIYAWATEIFPRNLGLGSLKLGCATIQPGQPLVPPLMVRIKKTAKTTTITSLSSIVLPPLFPSLLELRIESMDNLEEWVAPPPAYRNSFPCLRSLIVRSCCKLRTTPISSFSSLSSLELCNTNDKAVGSILASLAGEQIHCLSIEDSPDLIFFPIHNNSQLQSLSISRCSKFQGFLLVNREEACSRNSNNSYLYSSKFTDCPALTSLPDLHSWTSLRKLWINNCDKLKDSIQYDLKSYKSLDTLFVDHVNLLGVPKSPVAGTGSVM